MFTQLYIKNYAIIDELKLSINNGFTVITGETGAGKSIVMGALGLVLGDRADSKSLLDANQKSVIEAIFHIPENLAVLEFLAANEYDVSNELILRREITPQGKSRAFINDTPCNLQQLKKVGEELIDLHRQFDTLDLQSNEKQLFFLDAFANLKKDVTAFEKEFSKYQQILQEATLLKSELEKANKEKDFLEFTANEIDVLKLQVNEIEDLQIELGMLQNAQGIQDSILIATQQMQENENPILQQLQSIKRNLSQHEKHLPPLEEIVSRFESLIIELKDISDELETLQGKVELNPERLELVENRLHEANRLLHKHRMIGTDELLAHKIKLEEKLGSLNMSDARSKELEQQLSDQKKKLNEQAQQIRQIRKKEATRFEKAILDNLQELGMEDARIQILLTEVDLYKKGNDKLDILFDANNTGNFLPVAKVASGGELSRLMLSIKYLIAKVGQMPCMIFDEIDTGISGDAAIKVAAKITQLAQNEQVMCITHLPQIAAKAKHHLFVFKEKGKNSFSTSSVKKLTDAERVDAIATMLSGNNPTETARAAAAELM